MLKVLSWTSKRSYIIFSLLEEKQGEKTVRLRCGDRLFPANVEARRSEPAVSLFHFSLFTFLHSFSSFLSPRHRPPGAVPKRSRYTSYGRFVKFNGSNHASPSSK